MLKSLLVTLSLAAVLLYSAPPAQAKMIKIVQPKHQASEIIEKDVGIIQIIGEINQDTDEVVHRGFMHFKKEGIKTVIIHLNSLGGELQAGQFIVSDIIDAEQHGIAVITDVDHKDFCASMCTGIFATGVDRMAARDTIWIFHAPFVKLTDEEKKDPQLVENVNKVLKEAQDYMLGLYNMADPEWTDKVLKEHITTPGSDYIVTGDDIIQQHNQWILISIDD